MGRSFRVSTHGGDRKPQSTLADFTEQSKRKSFVLFEFYANSFLLNAYNKSKFSLPLCLIATQRPLTSNQCNRTKPHLQWPSGSFSSRVYTLYYYYIIIYTPRRIRRTFLLIYYFIFLEHFLFSYPLKREFFP